MNSKDFKNVTDKKFLKRNDFAVFVKSALQFCKDYKGPLILLVIVVLGLLVAVPILDYQKTKKAEGLSESLYLAEKADDKAAAYEKILQDYSGFSGVQLARLQFVDWLIKEKKIAEALVVLDEGLKQTKEADILSTLLLLRKVASHVEQNDNQKAIETIEAFADKAIPSYQDSLKLMKAKFLLASDKVADAKLIYENMLARGQDASDPEKNHMNPQLVKEAKEQLLLIKLGKL